MTAVALTERGVGKLQAIFFLAIVFVAGSLLLFRGAVRQFVREALMQKAASTHYEILCPQGALSPDAMMQFAAKREPLFASLNKKLHEEASQARIRIVLDPQLPVPPSSDTGEPYYAVAGTTIRMKLTGKPPRLPAAADAEALLSTAWGKPGNAQVARWIANWLVGEWRGAEIGMAAAQVEQRLGHKNVESLLIDPGGEIASADDRTLLGAAWISEIAEFGGAGAVKKLYAAKMLHPNVAAVSKSLGTTPLELDRKWQLWMYAYLAGMPSPPQDSGMQMDMPMGQRQ
jgi:hypothetical protein